MHKILPVNTTPSQFLTPQSKPGENEGNKQIHSRKNNAKIDNLLCFLLIFLLNRKPVPEDEKYRHSRKNGMQNFMRFHFPEPRNMNMAKLQQYVQHKLSFGEGKPAELFLI